LLWKKREDHCWPEFQERLGSFCCAARGDEILHLDSS
jgi:hypothetical protein